MSQLKKRAILLSLVIVSSLFVFYDIPSTFAQTPATAASITFTPETVSVKSGETFATQLWIDTDGASVGGIGTKINFDPALLSVETIETQSVFPDYPAKTFDNITGKVVISGIVNSKDELYTGKTQFATINWKAKGSGKGSIALEFSPNETKDSNIAVLYGNGDILQKVNSVTVQVEPTNDQFPPASDESIPVTTELTTQNTPPTPSKSFSLSPLEMGLGLATVLSLALNAYLFLKVKRAQPYKEEIPHIQTPSVTPQQ